MVERQSPDNALEDYFSQLLNVEDSEQLEAQAQHEETKEETEEENTEASIEARIEESALESSVDSEAKETKESLDLPDVESKTEAASEASIGEKIQSAIAADDHLPEHELSQFQPPDELDEPDGLDEPSQVEVPDQEVKAPEVKAKESKESSMLDQIPDQALLEDYKKRKLQELLDQPLELAEEPSDGEAGSPTPIAVETAQQPIKDLASEQEQIIGSSENEDAVIDDNDVESNPPHVQDDLLTQERLQLQKEYLQWHENGRPLWAQERFEALLFNVGGLNLAVPLVVLGHIHSMDEKLTPIFGQQDWFLGLLNTPMGKIKTVDTAKFVMPERYKVEMAQEVELVISIDCMDWGLAVKAVNQPIQLEPEDVSWRTERSKRPWLAGTVKSKMCALIDVPQMAQMLKSFEK